MADSSGSEEEQEDGTLGALISFANLENVMKHMIKKFKSIEAYTQSNDAAIVGLKNNLETRATVTALEEMMLEINQRFDSVQESIVNNKEGLLQLTQHFDKLKASQARIDKRVDCVVKEKAVQDRMIREIQDALQDKVSLAELNMFEAKFAGYTTKLEHQQIISALSDYASVDIAERIAENVKVLATRFDDYARTSKMEQQIQEVRDWVGDELTNYAKSRQTNDRIEELASYIKEQSLVFDRVYAASDDKLRGLSDRLTSMYEELSSDIQLRAMADDLSETKASLRKYALRSDTEAFQQDCVPKLRFCVDSIKAFDDRLRAQDDAIQRVDEVLLDKAAKYDIVILTSRVDQCFQKEAALKEIQKMYDKLQWFNEKFEQYVEQESQRLDSFRPPDYAPMFEEMNAKVMLKADKADLVEMYQLKANRIDADELCKLQDTIHRQLEYLAVTNFGLSKLTLTEAKQDESKTIRTQQKSQVLMQAEALWHWILHNEPPPNLDTLRPPPGRGGQTGMGASVTDGFNRMDATQQKRSMDDQKRLQLERKLGITFAQ
eukprot:TRINITY_DN10491_c0_g6_i1.p1 TRINITY_DN10491_c0_g6~~TRINITY_DN10491_c0_g6_i1.p1  ORF type:complete len:549 (-),score=131.36 TRINITY_DN10491_c0_g6_i1:146-1792(-)